MDESPSEVPGQAAGRHPLDRFDGRRAIATPIAPLRWLARPVEVTFETAWRDGGPAIVVETVRLTGGSTGYTERTTTTLLTKDRQARARRRLEAGRWTVNDVPVDLVWCSPEAPPALRRGNVSLPTTSSGFGAKRLAAVLTVGPAGACLGVAAGASDSGDAWWPWVLLAVPAVIPGVLFWRWVMRRYGGSLWT